MACRRRSCRRRCPPADPPPRSARRPRTRPGSGPPCTPRPCAASHAPARRPGGSAGAGPPGASPAPTARPAAARTPATSAGTREAPVPRSAGACRRRSRSACRSGPLTTFRTGTAPRSGAAEQARNPARAGITCRSGTSRMARLPAVGNEGSPRRSPESGQGRVGGVILRPGPEPCGAGDGNRTRVASLEDWGSTIELRPHRPRRASERRGTDRHRSGSYALAAHPVSVTAARAHRARECGGRSARVHVPFVSHQTGCGAAW